MSPHGGQSRHHPSRCLSVIHVDLPSEPQLCGLSPLRTGVEAQPLIGAASRVLPCPQVLPLSDTGTLISRDLNFQSCILGGGRAPANHRFSLLTALTDTQQHDSLNQFRLSRRQGMLMIEKSTKTKIGKKC